MRKYKGCVMQIDKKAVLVLSLMLGVAAGTQPAAAVCFESGVGCPHDHYTPKRLLDTLSCDVLWTIRNSIYDEKGLCFKTARAKNTFSNEDCSIDDPSSIKLNRYEQTNIERIVSVERKKGCR